MLYPGGSTPLEDRDVNAQRPGWSPTPVAERSRGALVGMLNNRHLKPVE
ncbi:MAG: hypothetical protein ACFB10_24900 [Salibacteraceae bacterium]